MFLSHSKTTNPTGKAVGRLYRIDHRGTSGPRLPPGWIRPRSSRRSSGAEPRRSCDQRPGCSDARRAWSTSSSGSGSNLSSYCCRVLVREGSSGSEPRRLHPLLAWEVETRRWEQTTDPLPEAPREPLALGTAAGVLKQCIFRHVILPMYVNQGLASLENPTNGIFKMNDQRARFCHICFTGLAFRKFRGRELLENPTDGIFGSGRDFYHICFAGLES